MANEYFRPYGVLATSSKTAYIGLAWNCIGLMSIIAWTAVTSFIMFYTLKKFNLLRVSPEMEFRGRFSEMRSMKDHHFRHESLMDTFIKVWT